MCVSRNLLSKEYQIDPYSYPAFYLSVVVRIRICSTQSLSCNASDKDGTGFWKRSRTSRSTPRSPCCGSCPSTFRWLDCTLDFAEDRLSAVFGVGAFRSGESISAQYLCAWCLVVPLWNTVDLEFGSQSRDNFHPCDKSSGPLESTLNSPASKFEVSIRLSFQAGSSVIFGGERGDLYT